MFNLNSKAARRADAIRRRWCDPTALRHWHKPADPIHAARIEAAEVKRARKAVTLERSTLKSDRNAVHLAQASDSLLPFYIAK